MRRQTAILAVCVSLCGCSTIKGWFTPSPPPIVQPDAPTAPSVVTSLGDSLDQSDGKVAAAITVANRNADRPDVVRAETKVALSYLPPPSEGDLAIATARAEKADPKTYALAEADGRKLLAAVDAKWASLEADQKKAKAASEAKDKQIAELTAKIAQIEAEADKTPLRIAAGLAFLAAIGLGIAGQYTRAGVCVALGAAFLGVSTILSSPWFIWSLIATGTACLGLVLWVVWDKARDAVHQSDKIEPAANNDPLTAAKSK